MLTKSCVMLIETELLKLNGIQELKVRMGEVSLKFNPDLITQIAIERKLTDLGFQPIFDNDAYIAEQIKIAAVVFMPLKTHQ
jgi:copper chaperone CopZ